MRTVQAAVDSAAHAAHAAYDAYDALVAADSYAGSSASAWGVSDRSPVGGWNICSRDKTEYGEPDLERAPGG